MANKFWPGNYKYHMSILHSIFTFLQEYRDYARGDGVNPVVCFK